MHDASKRLEQAYRELKGENWELGFNLFENREVRKVQFHLGLKTPLTRAPIWEPGFDISGRHVIVLNEQGVGDTIMYSRFIPLLKELPIKSLSIHMQKDLMPLIARLEGIDGCLYTEDCESPAVRVKIMSLPALLLQYNMFPRSRPDKVFKSNNYLKTKGIKKTQAVGFCWRSDNQSWNSDAKKIPQEIAEKFYKKLSKTREVVSLQVNADFMTPYLSETNWRDTADKLQALNAIVSVDTAVAHLGGALGVRTLNLVGSESQTGWFYHPSGTEKTRWYDSMELIWYEPYTNWEAGLEEALKKLCR